MQKLKSHKYEGKNSETSLNENDITKLRDLLNKKDSKLKLGIFNLPILESELE